MEKRTCSFCGGAIELGTGKMFVKRDGTVYHFCSSKCEKNLRLGRIARRVAWTEPGRLARKRA
ncbi:MAG TPA: 50S ribosomal protein L24e [Candidatus Bathyarchaeia archaeon]|nr:50S ribosomal protein L24e [Candidatus Bathyarchaeia archaeon]